MVEHSPPVTLVRATYPPFDPRSQSLARWILSSFLFTFMMTRILVFLIVSRRVPDLYLHLGGTHVHHLNYGIFILSALGAYLLFARPEGRALRFAAYAYGIGLALTFDEFGMWLHLGGSYWQRASFDAVVVIAGLFGLIVVAPRVKRFRPHHWITTAAMTVSVLIFTALLIDSFHYASRLLIRLQVMEASKPPLP